MISKKILIYWREISKLIYKTKIKMVVSENLMKSFDEHQNTTEAFLKRNEHLKTLKEMGISDEILSAFEWVWCSVEEVISDSFIRNEAIECSKWINKLETSLDLKSSIEIWRAANDEDYNDEDYNNKGYNKSRIQGKYRDVA